MLHHLRDLVILTMNGRAKIASNEPDWLGQSLAVHHRDNERRRTVLGESLRCNPRSLDRHHFPQRVSETADDLNLCPDVAGENLLDPRPNIDGLPRSYTWVNVIEVLGSLSRVPLLSFCQESRGQEGYGCHQDHPSPSCH
jgi:hypothetical protein